MAPPYSYAETFESSQKISWRIEDVIGGERRLDFDRPFLPESIARGDGLAFLSGRQRLLLNQIRGHAYLCILGLVEEFILPFVLDHARARLDGDDLRTRALLQFAGEEAKHIHLFKRFRADFEAGFGHPCEIIGPAEEVADFVLSRHPLAVALMILHIEWMTQSHYLDSVRDEADLDPQFKSLLRHHWMEESQHAKLDALMVDALARACTPAEIEGAVEQYLAIASFLDEGLRQQSRLDLESLERAGGRTLGRSERETFLQVQHQANRWTYLGSGMTHPRFLASLETLGSGARTRIDAVAPAFC